MSSLYVLRLDGGNYFISKCSEPTTTFMSHWMGKENEITKIYRPRGIELVIENVSDKEAHIQIQKYKVKHGSDKIFTNLFSVISIKNVDTDFKPLFNRIIAQDELYNNCCSRNTYIKNVQLIVKYFMNVKKPSVL